MSPVYSGHNNIYSFDFPSRQTSSSVLIILRLRLKFTSGQTKVLETKLGAIVRRSTSNRCETSEKIFEYIYPILASNRFLKK